MSLYRLRSSENGQDEGQPEIVPLAVYLDGLENRRNALIVELRGIDRQLVAYGRLKGETLPRRVR
ncbi:MAG: hypothetical protein WBO48_13450 [Candidatus Promineifilaceae bacterium]